jgi:hypothetical protein
MHESVVPSECLYLGYLSNAISVRHPRSKYIDYLTRVIRSHRCLPTLYVIASYQADTRWYEHTTINIIRNRHIIVLGLNNRTARVTHFLDISEVQAYVCMVVMR